MLYSENESQGTCHLPKVRGSSKQPNKVNLAPPLVLFLLPIIAFPEAFNKRLVTSTLGQAFIWVLVLQTQGLVFREPQADRDAETFYIGFVLNVQTLRNLLHMVVENIRKEL